MSTRCLRKMEKQKTKEKNQNEYFWCYSGGLAVFLLSRGFQIVSETYNKKDIRYKVYLFEDTPQLRESLADYSKKRK